MKKFFIVTTARSGSSWFSRKLAGIFNLNFLRELDTQKVDEMGFGLDLDKIFENMKRGDFFKIMYLQIENNEKMMDDFPCIHLIRKDGWAQAISNHIMRTLNISHTSQMDNLEVKEIKVDFNEVLKISKEQLGQKIKFINHLDKRNNVLKIYYEDIEEKEYWNEDLINKFSKFLESDPINMYFEPINKKGMFMEKTRDYYKIINLEEVDQEEMKEKYWIK